MGDQPAHIRPTPERGRTPKAPAAKSRRRTPRGCLPFVGGHLADNIKTYDARAIDRLETEMGAIQRSSAKAPSTSL